MICTSLKTETGIADYKQLLPWPVSFRSFVKGWKGGKFLVYIWNTVRVAGLCVVGTVCSCSLVAFGFAKFQSKAKNVLFLVLLATMMVPQTVTLIPMYIMYSRFHWLNTIYPLVLPAFFGTSTFNIFCSGNFLPVCLTIWRRRRRLTAVAGSAFSQESICLTASLPYW